MKLLFVALLAIVAAAESLRCEPNTNFNSYCNTCRCSSNGKTALCTLKSCDTRIWNSDGTRKDGVSVQPRYKRSTQECVSHSTFKNYCNTCICGADGKTMACTLMYCDPRVWNKNGTLKDGFNSDEEPKSQESQKQVCEPHTTFKDYCNTCTCGADGKTMACTLMYCDLAVWNKDGTRKSQVDEESESEKESDLICEPNSVFKDYCNTCKCSKDGKNAACTLMACDPRVWNKNGTKKIASKFLEAEESKEMSPEAPETKKWGPLYKQGNRCTPGESFYSECNLCICDRDGKSAFCTYELC